MCARRCITALKLHFSALVLKASVSICHSQMKWSHHILIHASHSAEGWALWKSPIVWFDRVQLRALPLSCSCWPERTGARPQTAGMWRWAMTGFLSLSLMFCPPVGAKRVMWDVREHNDSLTCALWRSKHA